MFYVSFAGAERGDGTPCRDFAHAIIAQVRDDDAPLAILANPASLNTALIQP